VVTGFGFCTVAFGPVSAESGYSTTGHSRGLPGVLAGDRVVALAAMDAAAPDSMRGVLAELDRWTDAVEIALEKDLPWRDAAEVEFLPPVTEPSAIYCAGANYFDHLAEMGAGEVRKEDLSPFHFLTAPSAMVGHRAEVPRPEDCRKLDWEVELAAVIGRRAFRVDEADALDVVAGYTIANDVSARDWLDRRNPALGIDWLRHKSFAGLLPIGPALVPARFVDDPTTLELRLSVNGEIRQDSSTAKMVFSLAEQIAALSQVTPLLPGDVVLTGTPAGTAAAYGRYLEPGDVMTCEISRLGVLENRVV
jgi:2-keto-4-pentenoate hydratase/2-oxohepta-3-ene-1,7-dioic acid hydratase in catechol pathway